MPATLKLKTHEVSVNKQGETLGTRVTPYIRLYAEDGPPIFLQGGAYFYEGGEQVPDEAQPDWLFDMQKKCNPEALKACGFKT
jgi:hypothetical protein